MLWITFQEVELELDDTYRALERHLASVDREFSRVFKIYADRMQCRKGCSMCCSQMFSISCLEAAYISRAVKQMPAERREALRARASEYKRQRQRMLESADRTEDDGVFPLRGLRLQCPALENDACSIYPWRPIICRKWGIPLFNPYKPREVQACELNFKPGEEISAEGLIEGQAELLEDWVALKQAARRNVNYSEIRVTVADAILDDWDSIVMGPADKQG